MNRKTGIIPVLLIITLFSSQEGANQAADDLVKQIYNRYIFMEIDGAARETLQLKQGHSLKVKTTLDQGLLFALVATGDADALKVTLRVFDSEGRELPYISREDVEIYGKDELKQEVSIDLSPSRDIKWIRVPKTGSYVLETKLEESKSGSAWVSFSLLYELLLSLLRR